MTARGIVISTLMEFLVKAKKKGEGNTLKGFLMTGRGIVISTLMEFLLKAKEMGVETT
jgi:hypothetical protein